MNNSDIILRIFGNTVLASAELVLLISLCVLWQLLSVFYEQGKTYGRLSYGNMEKEIYAP